MSKFKSIELNKSFDTQEQLFKALKDNANKIIDLKKSKIHSSCTKGQLSIRGSYLKLEDSVKAVFGFKEDYIYPVINTTKYLDSHRDVHFDGIWSKTLKEQKGTIYYVEDHQLKVDSVIAWPEDVKAFTKKLPWILVGKDFEGETQALIFEIAKEKIIKQSAIDVVEQKRNVENSVRMQYVKIKLAVNSDDDYYKEEKAYFDKKYHSIANKEDVDKIGYFWGVEEAKIFKEGSMVLAGSNDATPILTAEEEKHEPLDDTRDKDSTLDEPEKSVVDYFKENF